MPHLFDILLSLLFYSHVLAFSCFFDKTREDHALSFFAPINTTIFSPICFPLKWVLFCECGALVLAVAGCVKQPVCYQRPN